MTETIEPGTEPDAEPTSPAVSWAAPVGSPRPPSPAPAPPGEGTTQSAAAGGAHENEAPKPRLSDDLASMIDRAEAKFREWDERLGSSGSSPVDAVRSAVEWWYRPLVEARTWVALGWLFVGALAGPFLFIATVVILVTTFGLMFALVGFLLVVPAAAAIAALTGLERRRAGWVGEPIPPPRFADGNGGVFSAIGARLTDPARWRQVLFAAVFLFGGPLLFAVGVLPWTVLYRLVFAFDVFNNPLDISGLLLAIPLAGLAPRITVAVANVGRRFVVALLGPTEAEELQERVTELSDQRQQILDAVAAERRRIERNLHDGVQQQLVAIGIDIGRASSKLDDPDAARDLLDEARDKLRGSIGELRIIGRGLHPAVLEDRGIDAALSAVVASSPIPISVDVTVSESLPEDVAATAYYVASEAVANLLKHSGARTASIRLQDDPVLAHHVRLTVHDDGRGGAGTAGRSTGSGIAGMRARIEGVDGRWQLSSPAGGPTTIEAVLPLAGARRRSDPPTGTTDG